MTAIRIAVFAALALTAAGPASPKTVGKARTQPVDTIVIHAIGGPVCRGGRVVFEPVLGDVGRWKAYLEDAPVNGVHYVIGRDGAVAASIPEDQVANHAGPANARSIGIELVNRGDGLEPYPEAQLKSLAILVRQIRARHSVPLGALVAHSFVDQRTCTCGDAVFARRQDPGAAFPMDRLREQAANPGETVAAPDIRPQTGEAAADACPRR